MNVSKRQRSNSFYFGTTKATIGIQTAIGPVPIKGSIEIYNKTTQTTSNSKGVITSSNDICSQAWSARIYRPIPKYIYHPGTINYTQYLHPGTGTGIKLDEGMQGVIDLYHIFPITNFIDGAYFGNGQANGPSNGRTLADNIFSLDINKKSTDGVGETPVNSNVKAITNHVYLKNVKLDHQWVNVSSNPLMFDIYWCMCMKSTRYGPLETWQRCLEYERQGQGNTDSWNQFNNNPVAGKPTVNSYGQVPTSIKAFNDMYKVLKKEHFVLQAGGRCNTYTKFAYNYLASQAIMKELQGNDAPVAGTLHNRFIGGLTIVPMVVVKGYAIYNNGEKPFPDPDGLFTYSGGQFGYVIKQDYTFVPVQLEDKFPYNRVFSSAWNEAWNPAREKFVSVVDETAQNPVVI